MANSNQQQSDREETARLAYQIWEQRGRPEGHDVEFWLEAERQIVANNNSNRALLAVPAGASAAVGIQSPPGRATAKSPPPIPSRTSKQAAKSGGEAIPAKLRATMSPVSHAKASPGAAARP
jgi:hypothetical protein